MSEALAAVLLFTAGLVSGVLNVLAGGGSFLTLPILMMLGLPATAANGTNRVAILTQNLGAVWRFNRLGYLEWRMALWAVVPVIVGSVLGTLAALEVGDLAFRRILAFLMVVVTLWTLLDPAGRAARRRRGPSRADTGTPLPDGGITSGRSWGFAFAFFGIGLYTGFVQAGVGFLILAVLSMIGLDLVRGNALKVLVILVSTPFSLALFAWQGQVLWKPGLILAAGSLVGGQLGARLTVLKGHAWLRGFVTVAVIAFAIKLWFWP